MRVERKQREIRRKAIRKRPSASIWRVWGSA
jgi:hypothetical protein